MKNNDAHMRSPLVVCLSRRSRLQLRATLILHTHLPQRLAISVRLLGISLALTLDHVGSCFLSFVVSVVG